MLMILSDSKTSSSFLSGGTARWMSPELFDPEVQDNGPTKHSDCYALGMVIYEVLSGRMPFYQLSNSVVPREVFQGNRPERPEGPEGLWFTDEVWAVSERCWAHQPNDRPSVKGVLKCLEEASRAWTPPSQEVTSPPAPDSRTSNSFETGTEQSTDAGYMSFSVTNPRSHSVADASSGQCHLPL